MQQKTVAALAALLVAAPVAGQAQSGVRNPSCGSATPQAIVTQDACQLSSDLFQLFAPQLGAAIAGGNPTVGQRSTLGGFGRFSIGVRATALQGALPNLDDVTLSTQGAQTPRNLQTDDQIVGFPVADAAVGLFRGIPLGLTHVGGIDALVNATYIPNYGDETEDVRVETSGSAFKIGYGVRIGVIEESKLLPGVSVSVLRRELPTTSLTAQFGDRNESAGVRDLTSRLDSYRLVAGKRLLFIGLTAGIGRDVYTSGATINATVNNGGTLTPITNVALTQELTRNNAFANLTVLSLPFFKVAGEVGRSWGGEEQATFNSFRDGSAARSVTAPYNYASVSVRIGY